MTFEKFEALWAAIWEYAYAILKFFGIDYIAPVK